MENLWKRGSVGESCSGFMGFDWPGVKHVGVIWSSILQMKGMKLERGYVYGRILKKRNLLLDEVMDAKRTNLGELRYLL